MTTRKAPVRRDWNEIRLNFINSDLSVERFAEKYEIPTGLLSRHVYKGKWMDERKAFREAVFHKRALATVDERVAQLAKVDESFIQTSEDMLKKARELLPTVESPMALKSLAGTLKDLQVVMRLSLGASTENQATQVVQDFSDWLSECNNEQRDNQQVTH